MKIYVVGDSTLASFNDQYYYPRYGYATKLNDFFNDDVEIINKALSGRSSRSYILDPEYEYVFNNIKKGDYLIIGFGHNDEKDDDFLRFSDARLDISNEKSFKYSIYNYYVKKAIDLGVTPIITTPVVRIAKKYEGVPIHDTPNGNYKDALIELGKEKNIEVFDFTTKTKELFEQIGYDEAIYHHAMTQAIKIDNKLVADVDSVDKTHLNTYGAKYVAWLFAEALNKSNLELKKYLKKDYKMPTKEEDLIPNKDYKYYEYNLPNLDKYLPSDNFKTNTKDFYGTAFGPFENINDLQAYEKDGKYIVGTKTLNGRTNTTCDSYVCVFRQISIKENIKISAKAKILEFKDCKQSSFGIQLRDDIYINSDCKRVITSNSVCAGLITADASTNIIYSRASTTELKKENNVINEFYKKGEELFLEIERLGQKITVNVSYRNKKYEKYYFDFDLTKIDKDYYYACLYASKGVLIEFSDVNFEIIGIAKEA